VKGAVLETECDDALALAVLHQQVEGEVLNEVVAVVPVKTSGKSSGSTTPKIASPMLKTFTLLKLR
jgi:hypothetical protein